MRRTLKFSAGLLLAANLTAAAGGGMAYASQGARIVPALNQAKQNSDGLDPLDQSIAENEGNASGAAVLDQGHVDMGPRLVDGIWKLSARDDSSVPAQWRSPGDVVFHVLDAAIQQAPAGEEFAFVNAMPGQNVHVIPQTQKPGVLWLGWNTQDPEIMKVIERGVTLTFHGATGPGHTSVFLQNGNFGAPEVLWDSDVAKPQPLWVDVNTHTHANWAFTAPGLYELDIEASATLVGGKKVSDRQLLRVAVGTATAPVVPLPRLGDADSARSTASAAPAADDGSATSASNSEPVARGLSPILLGSVGGALLVAAAVAILGASRSRRAKSEVDADFERNRAGDAGGTP